ncbi:hypothetical protein CYLTODRAFT_484732 [Cylindrobasidium torrendii FP15055 ss-10]|uniref:C2H2-type domain-containing protein n=1 Tax=Cylindrobasidium torrendii FP15055 ss-10 TaxID=1314674 RepID=A0A0D7BXN8_9AGAR|nr:hypothetical protein CYLTODRAFT_484732 [Cylindrobasidium torrendii FP15055 ss-10]
MAANSQPDATPRPPFPLGVYTQQPDGSLIPTGGPVSHPAGPPPFQYLAAFSLPPGPQQSPNMPPGPPPESGHASVGHHLPPGGPPTTPDHSLDSGRDSQDPDGPSGVGTDHYPSSSGVPRLPPILQVEKQQVTTSATQLASANRRRNEAHFQCPVPGCGSTFTRRFNLRGHLRSHTEERPYVCQWPGCKKGFARQHDCKRHQALHTAKAQANVCLGCKKTFSRLDALNRHLRSEGGQPCREAHETGQAATGSKAGSEDEDKPVVEQPKSVEEMSA